MPKRIVIIGGGTAGASAAFAARKQDKTAQITILNKEHYSTYSRCGLPFAISGVIPAFENLVVFQPKSFALQKIDLKLGVEAIKIDARVKQIVYQEIGKSGNQELLYDALIIASGAVPVKPSIKGVDAPNVRVLRTMDEAKNIVQSAQAVKSVVIIGASFIGLELADALKERGLNVTLIEKDCLLWRILDEDICRVVKDQAVKSGIEVKERESVGDIGAFGNSLVVITAGVRPDVQVAKDAGIEIGPTGGIKTNQYLQTNLPDVYAAGDCAESVSAITGEPITIGLGTIAARQGVVAGVNAVAGAKTTAPKILNASVLKAFGLEIGSVGFTQAYYEHRAKGIEPVSTLLKYPSLPHYYPGGADVYVKLIADKTSGAVIGAQTIGPGAVGRVNMLSLAVENKMKASDLIKADFCYSPPLADIWEPVAIAAQSLERQLNR